jgi:hypothetical protein
MAPDLAAMHLRALKGVIKEYANFSLIDINIPLTTCDRMYETGRYSDLTIICGDRHFKVHRHIMQAQSEVFSKMLAGKFKVWINKAAAEQSVLT